MADDEQRKGSLVPEVVRVGSRSLEALEEKPTRLSRFAMRKRNISLEKETELIETTTKNQEARLRLLRAAERLKRVRLDAILDGDAAREEADYLAAANAAEDEVRKAELAEERANTAKLKERSEQARLRAEIAENEARLERTKGKRDGSAKTETLVERMFRVKLGVRATEQEIRQHAANEIAAIQQRAGDRSLSESEEREIKNIQDAMNALINDL